MAAFSARKKIRQNTSLALGNGLTLEGTDNAKANVAVIKGALFETAIIHTLDLG